MSTKNIEHLQVDILNDESETSQQNVGKKSQQKVDKVTKQKVDETSEQNVAKITKPLPMKKVVFLSGDLAWARLGSAPFWPCIVLSETEVDPNMLSQESEKDKTFFVQVTLSNHLYL
jgi:hypothetical protein